MRLEEGKTYRDANGNKQGPLKDFGGGTEDKYGWSPPNEDWFWWDSGGKAEPGYGCVDLIAEWTDGPVRTVTRREVVEGVYGIIRVDTHRDQVVISIDPSDGHNPSAAELKAAAAVLLELAGALDDGK